MKLGNNVSLEKKEEERKKIFKLYFKALSKTTKFKQFVDNNKEKIIKSIKTPERELEAAIFNRGLENLFENMKMLGHKEVVRCFLEEGISLDSAVEQTKLCNRLKLLDLKKELDQLRKEGNISGIAKKELKIAKRIHRAVSVLHHRDNAGGSSQMIKNQEVNCLGASMLGVRLLNEFEINSLVVSMFSHVATLLVTADKRIYWQDFVYCSCIPENFQEITPSMLGKKIKIETILDKTNNNESVLVQFKDFNPYTFLIKGKLVTSFLKPEIGLCSSFLNNLGCDLYSLDRNEEALVACNKALDLEVNDSGIHKTKGRCLSELSEYDEAIEVYDKAIVLNPNDNDLYRERDELLAVLSSCDEG